jgi:hypothetical protein
MEISINYKNMRFQILKPVNIKTAVLGAVAPCNLVDGYNIYGGIFLP